MNSRRGVSIALLVLAGVASVFSAFGQTIVLPRAVPAFNQAYTEGIDAWGRCALGTDGCPDTIYATGCLITAFASVLAYYDIDVSVSAVFSCTGSSRIGMDPGILNDWLRENGGYGRCTQDPSGNCCLIWERLPAGIEITTHVNRSDVGLNPVSAVVLDHALRQGYPVIAGVHYGTFCGGSTRQSEDCHWVVVTGKRDDTYSIVDPFNSDTTSPYGIRTTLDAGVHGRYIIDRFVVVEPASGSAAHLTLLVTPSRQVFQVEDRVRVMLQEPAAVGPVLPYAQAMRPNGQLMYAVQDTTSASGIRWSTVRQSLVAEPVSLSSGWTLYDHRFAASDVGSWSWEVWVERPGNEGVPLDRVTLSYEVTPAETSVGAAVVGVLLVLAIAVVAFVSTLGTSQE